MINRKPQDGTQPNIVFKRVHLFHQMSREKEPMVWAVDTKDKLVPAWRKELLSRFGGKIKYMGPMKLKVITE